jgi:hypothetical protein
MTLKEKAIIINENPLPTLASQLEFGFTEEEAKQNLKDSEFKVFYYEAVKEAVDKFIEYKKSCMFELDEDYDRYNPDEVNDYYEKKHHNNNIETDLEKIKEIFGDFEK